MSFELFLRYQKMVTFWTYADESGTTLKCIEKHVFLDGFREKYDVDGARRCRTRISKGDFGLLKYG